MKRTIPLILDTGAVLALAFWLGGLALLWMAVAPALRAVPAESLGVAQTILARSLTRLGATAETCGLLLAGIQWALRRRYQSNRSQFIADGVRTLLLFTALFFAEYGRYILIPTFEKLHTPGALDTLEVIAIVQAVMLIGYAAVTCWLQSPQPAVVVAAPAAPRPAPPRTAVKRKRG